jgi:hypothetical protein
MTDKVQYHGGREGERFLGVFEKDFLKLDFLRFFVHDTDDASLKNDTVYSYVNLPPYSPNDVKPHSVLRLTVNLEILKKPLEEDRWGGCRDTKNFPLGDVVFFRNERHYASYFYERNILFVCDLAHAWERELNPNVESQKISTDVWKILVSTISEFKVNRQTKKPTCRVALVLEDWGKSI